MKFGYVLFWITFYSFVWAFFGPCYSIFWPVQWTFQVHKNENSLIFPVRIHLHGWCVSQLQRYPKLNGAGTETWIQSCRFLLHMANPLCFTVRIGSNHSNSILVHFAGWHFHALQTLVNQWLPNCHINMISSNIMPLGSFFFQLRPLDTLWNWLHDTLTAIERFHCNCFQFFYTSTLT